MIVILKDGSKKEYAEAKSVIDISEGLAVLHHTASHVLAQAVQTLYLDAIEKEMKKIIKKGAKIERFTKSREDAEISFYSQGDWTDLCAGPHLMNVKGVKAFKLLSSSGTYWRGNEKNAMLTRIYGTAYASKDELKEHLDQMEEAKRRDHNKPGREMKIFTTVDVIGQGLPLIMPNGVIIMQELQRWIEDEETKRGYVRTKTPLMAKSDLYKISGHWDHYKDGMFVLGDEGLKELDGFLAAIKEDLLL